MNKRINYIERSSIGDLYTILSKLRLKDVVVIPRYLLSQKLKDPKVKNIIFNLDKHGEGSHWVALNVPKKKYFDSYAEEMPLGIPKGYTRSSTNKELQSLSSNDCGQLCCLWLYYINYKSNKEYYDKFKDVY